MTPSCTNRMVTCFQLSVWIGVGVFLIWRGVWTLPRNSPQSTIAPSFDNSLLNSDNETCCNASRIDTPHISQNSSDLLSDAPVPPPRRNLQQLSSSVAMIITGVAMVIVGPGILVCKKIDNRRQHQRLMKLLRPHPLFDDLQETSDAPPAYEEAIEMVPRYSSLFHQLEDGTWVPTTNEDDDNNDERTNSETSRLQEC